MTILSNPAADSLLEKLKNWEEPGIFSHMIQLCVGGEQLEDGCISLLFTDNTTSALSLWHKRALKISYKKY